MKIERFIPPASHPLHAYVQSVFYSTGGHARELVLPKCNVDVLFNFGEPIEVARTPDDTRAMTWRRTLVAGMQTGAIVARPEGNPTILGVSLKAATCRAVVPLPLCEITDLVVDGALVFPEVDLLWECLGLETDFAGRCRRLLGWLSARVEPPSRTAMIHSACGLLDVSPDPRRIDEIARTSAVSPRHLRRLFQHHVGVGPSQYLRLSRFRTALHLMESPRSLTQVAYDAFYSDHAHFCRDFRDIAGLSPTQYRRHAGPAPGHLFYPADAK